MEEGVVYMVDAIVFTQDELNTAIDSGAKHIILCDNNFTLPQCKDIEFISVGKVKTSADKKKKSGKNTLKKMSSSNSSYFSSYKPGSYFTSYRYKTSFISSYLYNYRYEYEYRTSHAGSYVTSYRLLQSYNISFGSGFKISSFLSSFNHKIYDRILKEISVNGYGIHLI